MDVMKDVLLAVFGNFFLILFTAIAISCKRNGKRHYWVWYIVGAVQQVINAALLLPSVGSPDLMYDPPRIPGLTTYPLSTIPLLFIVVSAVLIIAGAVAVKLVKKKEQT